MSIDEDRFEVAAGTSAPALDLRGFTLIVPCVSIGSVPQLAIDVLLENVGQESAVHVCDLDHRFCVPFVGGAQSSTPSSPASPLQVFAFSKARVCVVQQRSPVLKARKHDFVQALSRWIRRRAFADVVVLSSLDAGLRTDAQMQHPVWHLPATTSPADSCSAKLAATLPPYTSSTTDKLPPLPSAGLARRLLQSAQLDAWPPTTAVLVFAAEGDNRADAIAVAQLLLSTMSVSPRTPLVEPSDWRLLFGPGFQPGMF